MGLFFQKWLVQTCNKLTLAVAQICVQFHLSHTNYSLPLMLEEACNDPPPPAMARFLKIILLAVLPACAQFHHSLTNYLHLSVPFTIEQARNNLTSVTLVKTRFLEIARVSVPLRFHLNPMSSETPPLTSVPFRLSWANYLPLPMHFVVQETCNKLMSSATF